MDALTETQSARGQDTLPTRPVTVLVAALGGEGGGVMADWLVAAANAQGFPVQSTSIPGVAQRTGATTYYLEIFPASRDRLNGRSPVLALTPNPGNIDVMVASELIEAGRAMQNGYVSPDRTVLIASTHRVYAIGEKSAMGDGRFDWNRLVEAAHQLAKQPVLFDMAALAQEAGTVINAVLFGAMVGAGALPLSRQACVEAIERTGKGTAASLRGFEAGYNRARGTDKLTAPVDGKLNRGRPVERVRAQFPAETHRIVEEGVARLIDYQDIAYADTYLDRLGPVLAADRDGGGGPGGHRLTNETARHLALWMSYEDLVRVADLKSRASRFVRVRTETGAKPDQPVAVTEFLKPGVEEFCSILPPALAHPILAWARQSGRSFHVGLHVRTSTVTGFLLMRGLARLRALRRRSSRFLDEQALIERWLGAIRRAATQDLPLALEVAECARLIKGYGDTHMRGTENFNAIFAALVDDHAGLATGARAAAIRACRLAALADPEGQALAKSLAQI